MLNGRGTTAGPCEASQPRWWVRPGCRAPLVLLVTIVAVVAAGCRSRAYQDVYVEKLSGEIRMLEDQLYQADYENEVLRQKLHRALERAELAAAARQDPLAPQEAFDGDALDADGMELDIDLGLPDASVDPVAPPDAIDEDPASDGDAMPPIQVLPPRAEEFAPPLIEPGEPAPPGGDESDDAEVPPGQIPTPESARMLMPDELSVPTSVSIHPGLSGGHHQDSDDEIDGVHLVLTVEDQFGQPMRTDLPISVVLLDPERSGEEARLGRWDYSADEVAEHVRENPLVSVQLPILWKQGPPDGDEVAVFVRVITAGGAPLETDMLMPVRSSTTADWSPRRFETRTAGIDPDSVWE